MFTLDVWLLPYFSFYQQIGKAHSYENRLVKKLKFLNYRISMGQPWERGVPHGQIQRSVLCQGWIRWGGAIYIL